MNKSFGRLYRPLVLAAMLVAGGLGLSLQAATADAAPSPSPGWMFYLGCLVILLVGAIGAWRCAADWRARVLRQRDEEVMKLMDQWTKSLQQEVADRKEAQRALQESQELTLRQERLAAVGQLAAGLAHEFNNVLTIIQGHAYLLLDNPNMDAESVKSVTQIANGVERTASLVKQMLAFSRKQVMRQRVVQIKESLGGITDMLGRLLGGHVALHFEVAPQLPCIMADPDMLQQILVNLVVNARDAMSSGGQLTIRATEVKIAGKDLAGQPERRAGQFIRLSVSDTGTGIDSATINRLFEPFFTTKDIGKGTGLGLATVYGMVKQNSGWIEVESTVGKGTTFLIYFPVTEKTLELPAPAKAATASRGQGETVLVVDDEEGLREMVREILEGAGYRVLEAASGRDALAVWEKERDGIDLVLTDMAMPEGVSGRDLAAKLQEENPRLPVIFSSGFHQDAAGGKPEYGPGQSFLSKPYLPGELIQAVRAALDSAGCAKTSMAEPVS